jgi:hypothetical protein
MECNSQDEFYKRFKMVTNLLKKKNELNMNAVMKQTAITARTRAQNVSLNKFRWNKIIY